MPHVTIEKEEDELLATTSVGQRQENSFNALIQNLFMQILLAYNIEDAKKRLLSHPSLPKQRKPGSQYSLVRC